jgi:hypothetical protein
MDHIPYKKQSTRSTLQVSRFSSDPWRKRMLRIRYPRFVPSRSIADEVIFAVLFGFFFWYLQVNPSLRSPLSLKRHVAQTLGTGCPIGRRCASALLV